MLDVVGMAKLCLLTEMDVFIITQFSMNFFMLWGSTMNSVAVTVTVTSALCGRTSLIVSLDMHFSFNNYSTLATLNGKDCHKFLVNVYNKYARVYMIWVGSI